ncbi:radical SAM protein [Aquisphaera insulae]|uniref:radical SAM protein n=1 Tax=Aquisphaera insulae TaxID=2712864 RepID=UPI00196B8FA3|nr:hypothetical protein [Aquisphaera insulae]
MTEPTNEPGASAYPSSASARTQWILERRPARNALDPMRPYAVLAETEPGLDGRPVDVATIFLTNRECPWRCLMCDLWRNTLQATVPAGAIAAQVAYGLAQLPPPAPGRSAIKLYNAGSFFDPHAIPTAEYPAVARLAAPFDRTIVECHPALVDHRVMDFRHLLPGRLEIAMGLETVHPEVLKRLNKRMTLDRFRRAAEFLGQNQIGLRVFILVRPPWLGDAEGLEWARRSLDFAFDCGAAVACLIPTRGGNGAMEELAASGEFSPPSLRSLELALEYGLHAKRAIVMADDWDIEKVADCPRCATDRVARIRTMNASQGFPPAVECDACDPTRR